MKVSVAIPCYNGEQYIGRTIESVLSQTYKPDEVLVIDDGSIDKSVMIVQTYPIRLIQHMGNKGLACARNTAVEYSIGEILAFLDVDAFADKDWLMTLLSGYDGSMVGGVGGQGIEANVHSLADQWRQAHAGQGHGSKPKDVDFLYGLNMSFRKKILELVGGFNPSFRTNAEDMDIGLRINTLGYRLKYLPNAKVYHQRTDDMVSLRRTMGAWYTSAYKAKSINNARPWTLFVGTLRRMVSDPLSDLIYRQSYQLAKTSWQMGQIKLRAISNFRSDNA